MRICVVEDELRVLKFLEQALRGEGHQVESCDGVEAAQTLLESRPHFDVLILDRMLKGRDGMDLIKPFRGVCPDARILILSAISSAEEKAAALDRGADDYLSKPFSLVELSARLRAMSRRGAPPTTEPVMLRLKDLSMEPVNRTAHVGERKLELANKEFRLLHLFVRNPGRVYNRFELLDLVWDTQFEIESNVVEVTIKNVRRKLEGAKSSVVIESRRNVGYWIEA